MTRMKTGATVSWTEVGIWVRQIEDHGYRARMVVAWEGGQKVRVSITLAQRDQYGTWREVKRDGELISDAAPGGAEKAALRACARLLGLIEELDTPRTQAHCVQLPLDLGASALR